MMNAIKNKVILGCVTALAAVTLVGCASAPNKTAPDGVLVQRSAQGEVQQAAFAPRPVTCDQPLNCPVLGLAWTADKPKQAVLTAGFTRGAHPPIEMVEFLARPYGPMRVRALAAEQADDQAAGNSKITGLVRFQLPIETLERLATSHGVLVRLHAGGHVYEETMMTGEHASPAFNATKRWLQQIYQGTDKEEALGLRGIFASEPYQR